MDEQGPSTRVQDSGVQIAHRRLKFVCRRCGHEYRDLADLLDCVDEHQREGRRES